MVIRGKEVDFKISRIEDAERYDVAMERMAEEEKEIPKKTKAAAVMRAVIRMLANFFKNATHVDVLEGCTDINEAKEAYYQFLREVSKQKEEVLTFTIDDIK